MGNNYTRSIFGIFHSKVGLSINCGHQHGSHTNYAQRHKVITNVQNIIWFRQRCLLEKIQII